MPYNIFISYCYNYEYSNENVCVWLQIYINILMHAIIYLFILIIILQFKIYGYVIINKINIINKKCAAGNPYFITSLAFAAPFL